MKEFRPVISRGLWRIIIVTVVLATLLLCVIVARAEDPEYLVYLPIAVRNYMWVEPTPTPTMTPTSTLTPTPTFTPISTNTPVPTRTSVPTATPYPEGLWFREESVYSYSYQTSYSHYWFFLGEMVNNTGFSVLWPKVCAELYNAAGQLLDIECNYSPKDFCLVDL